MEKVEILENPEIGTAGLSSAFQLVESTSSVSISFGTAPSYIILFPAEEKLRRAGKVRQDETPREMFRRVIKMHRKALDKLNEFR